LDSIRTNLKLAALLLFAAASVPAAAADYFDYPARAVRLVTGSVPGDPNDLLARIVAPPLAQFFRQPFIVDPVVGANGNRAASQVARAAHDGYTLLAVSALFATSVSIYPDLAYHPLRDFTPIARLATFKQMLIVNQSLGAGTLDDFLSLMRATPGRISIASAGTGTTSHLAGELMKMRAGWLNGLHVPYRGNGAALAGLLGNHVHALMATVSSAQAFVKSGRLKALAVADAKRVSSLPEVPTFAECGYPGIESSAWSGIVAPAGTPYEAIVRLSVAVANATQSPAVRQRLIAHGAELVQDTPEQFARYLHSEVEKWAKVVKASPPTWSE
jgi:tripartite-type tricarboxylate transporter receptor subunit TctC